MTKTAILEAIKNVEQTGVNSELVLKLTNHLNDSDREYFNLILQKREDLLLMLETDFPAEEIEKGLLYYIAFHGLLHLEMPAETLHEELLLTLKMFDLVELADSASVSKTNIEEKLLWAYSGILLLSEEMEHERANVEKALLNEFKLGGVLEPGLFGHRVNSANFKNVINILKSADQKILKKLTLK